MPNYHTFRNWPKVTFGVTLKKTFRKPKKPKGGFNDPTDIPDLVLWLDASDDTVLFQVNTGETGSSPVTADGQTVANWTDKSGNLNNVFQNGANNEPEYKIGIQNGLSVLRSSTDVVTPEFLERSPSVLSQDANITVFYVASLLADESGGVVYSNSDISTLRIATLANSVAASPKGFKLIDSTGQANALNPVDIGTEFNQFTSLKDGTDLTARLNGTAGTTVSAAGDGVTANDYTRVFTEFNDSGGLPGDIGELVVYDRTLNAGELNKVESYLKDKWATP